MAVDTRKKRMSMMSFGDGNTFTGLFEPDGTVDLGDRQHVLDCYSGIPFNMPVDFSKVNEQSNFDMLAG